MNMIEERTIKVYRWEALSEKAQDRALSDHCQTDFFWGYEYTRSLEHFAEALYAEDSIKDWCVGYPGSFITFQNLQENLRGLTLQKAKALKLSNGYSAGESLMEVFLREFENTGDAAYAFRQAGQTWLKEFEEDQDHYYSKEYLAEEEGVWYTVDGKFYDRD